VPGVRLISSHCLEFSAAHRLDADGRVARLHGHNYAMRAAVTGPMEPGRSVVEAEALEVAAHAAVAPFDYADLTLALVGGPASLERLAGAVWPRLAERLPPGVAQHRLDLREAGGAGVSLGLQDMLHVERATFAAAHRTHAPALSDAENLARYGICNNPAGHGHNYRVVVWQPVAARLPAAVWADLDHRNLSTDIPELHGRNVVTESVAALIAHRVPDSARVRVWETDTFFAECWPAHNAFHLGRRHVFSAAHQVCEPALGAEGNRRRYGRCGRPGPHGHDFAVEIVVSGQLDPRTETAFDLGLLDRAAAAVLAPLDHADLDHDIPHLARQINTPEALVTYLWSGLQAELGTALAAVSLAPTATNTCRLSRGDYG
jgi:6-pyruvoyltetrahydropterin/6-carboxytetrahydropterin synthase